jgi:hypothetical protein
MHTYGDLLVLDLLHMSFPSPWHHSQKFSCPRNSQVNEKSVSECYTCILPDVMNASILPQTMDRSKHHKQ